MRLNTKIAGLAALTNTVAAFPTVPNMEMTGEGVPIEARQVAPDPQMRFDPKTQYVPNTGKYKFIKPGPDDARGPCPGLNALANHGYLPRNGVGSHTDFITATGRVFGMSVDLAGFLTVLGGVLDGNGLQWSIGGPSKHIATLPLAGAPQGISGSHNKYECDVSPGRGDLYTHGNDFFLQMDQYQQLYDMAIKNGDNIDLPLLTEFRSMRFDDSIKNNPYFFNGPFSGVAVQPAAFTFIYRFMGNKSAEHPQGVLNTNVMNTFFGVKKNADGSLTKLPSQERIPDNWYKRAIGDEYSIPFFNTDLVLAALKYPKFLSVGGNLGKPNTFVGVSPEDISGGVYNAKTLSEGNNAMCFASQFLTQATPDMLKCSSLLGNVQALMKPLTDQITKSFGSLGCPQISKLDDSQFSQFPGYSKLNCKTGTYT